MLMEMWNSGSFGTMAEWAVGGFDNGCFAVLIK